MRNLPTAAVALLLCASMAGAQNYPSKPITLVTADAGGGLDFAARLVAQGMAAAMGQQVVVENRGGSVIIPAVVVAKAPADGYTLLFYGNAFWLLQYLREGVPYDVSRDFAPIRMIMQSPNVIVLHPAVPVNTVKELIAYSKARPGELNYATSVTGAMSHLSAELFKSMAGVNILRIPYKGLGPALNALIGNQVQVVFSPTGSVMSQVKSGRLKALAVTSAQPSALAPGLPTVAESGVPSYEATALFGMFVPAGTPAAIVNRLNQEITRILDQPESRDRLFSTGSEVISSSPQQTGAALKADMLKWSKVIKTLVCTTNKDGVYADAAGWVTMA